MENFQTENFCKTSDYVNKQWLQKEDKIIELMPV